MEVIGPGAGTSHEDLPSTLEIQHVGSLPSENAAPRYHLVATHLLQILNVWGLDANFVPYTCHACVQLDATILRRLRSDGTHCVHIIAKLRTTVLQRLSDTSTNSS